MKYYSEAERQRLWAERRTEIIANRYRLEDEARMLGQERPTFIPVPLTPPEQFLKPAVVITHRYVPAGAEDPQVIFSATHDPLGRSYVASALTPEQQFDKAQSKQSKLKELFRR
jgi:hypothetical protein